MCIKYRYKSGNKFTLIFKNLALQQNYTAINRSVNLNSCNYSGTVLCGYPYSGVGRALQCKQLVRLSAAVSS